MAMSAGGSAGALSNEMNVTPMIDVLLVLLIIFMAALPTMRKAIDVQLPDPNPSVATANQASDQIVLEVGPNGEYAINSEKVTLEKLGARLKEIYDPRPEKIMFVKGDPKVKYSVIMEALDIARGAGVVVLGVPPKDLGTTAGK
jgi:biopolymer transport protein TolR